MKKIITTLIAIAIIGYTIITGEYLDYKVENNVKQVANLAVEDFKIHFIDVGQGDSILIETNGEYMLVDAGNNADGPLLSIYFRELGIEKFKYVIGTHAHEDHIGGMDNIIRDFEVERFFMPNVITTTKTFETVLDELLYKNIKFETPNINDKFNVGDATFEILHVDNDEKDLNNTSIVIRVDYKNTSFLLTGDAEEKVEKKMSNLNVDVIKLGHHGSKYSTSHNFLDKVRPSIAIVSAGSGNKYGHPHPETIDKLTNIDLYNTISDGTIIIASDGDNIKISTVVTNTNG